jgi:translation initiation factor 3 subunit A
VRQAELVTRNQIAIDKLRESEIGRRIIELIGEEELYKYDPDSLNSLHIDAVIKHSREQKDKLKIQYKKVDYLIRAQHEAEVALIQKHSKEDSDQRREIQLAECQRALERRERLVRMDSDKHEFLQSIRGQRHEDFVEKMEEFEQRLNIARQQRIEQLRKENIEKKKQDWRKAKDLKKQQKQDEKQQRIQAEIKREETERLQVARAAARKQNEKLDKQAEIQREREAEIEKRLIAQNASQTSVTSPVSVRRPAPTQHKDATDRFVYSNSQIFSFSLVLLVEYGDVIHVMTRIVNHHMLILMTNGVVEMMINGKN